MSTSPYPLDISKGGENYDKNSLHCPDGGWYFNERCYWLIQEPTRKWSDANSYCSSKGTDLQLVVLKDDETIVSFQT